MAYNFIDLNTPRYQLPLEQLPRGFVKFPEFIVEHLEKEQARLGFRFAEEYAKNTLERHTLKYYYDGIPTAYRPAEGGIEVLAVGWEETGPYLKDPTVKVVQP